MTTIYAVIKNVIVLVAFALIVSVATAYLVINNPEPISDTLCAATTSNALDEATCQSSHY